MASLILWGPYDEHVELGGQKGQGGWYTPQACCLLCQKIGGMQISGKLYLAHHLQ